MGGSGRGTHVNPWLIHVNVWQKPLQYCKVVSLQLIKINEKKKIKKQKQKPPYLCSLKPYKLDCVSLSPSTRLSLSGSKVSIRTLLQEHNTGPNTGIWCCEYKPPTPPPLLAILLWILKCDLSPSRECLCHCQRKSVICSFGDDVINLAPGRLRKKSTCLPGNI